MVKRDPAQGVGTISNIATGKRWVREEVQA